MTRRAPHRRLATLCVAAAFLWTNGASAARPDQQRPLGVLISPVPAQPAPATQGNPDQERARPPETGRPLGILIDRSKSPKAAPPRPVTAPAPTDRGFVAPPHMIQPPNATSERPLGVLLDQKVSPKGPAFPAAPRELTGPPPSHAPRAPAFAQPGVSPERSLGTLLTPDTHSRLGGSRTIPEAGSPEPAPSPVPESGAEIPVNLAADEMTFDEERKIVSARGNVEVRYRKRRLFADEISYDQNNDTVTARGNVALFSQTAEQVFGDQMQITGDLKDAVIENIGIVLEDRARIAGAGARRSAGRITEMRKATYSPCNLCEDQPDRPPLWQIRAVKVIHDKDEKIVEYRDAWLEMGGLPVFYTPYFRHPDPTVRRQSGFLFPTYGSSSDFGLILETPYFWNISPHQDATITPITMTKEFPVLSLEYRNRLNKGRIDAAASVTDNQNNEFDTADGDLGVRGHIDVRGRFDIDRTWRWGFDLERTTDDTYLRRYGFNSPQSLDSRLFAEAFRSRSYFSASAHAFQGLEEGDSDDAAPMVLPLIDFNHVGKRDRSGGRAFLDFNMLAMTRAKGTDSRRLSLHPRWERPFISGFGDAWKITAGLNADLYHVNSLERASEDEQFTGFSYRTAPYVMLDWRRPVVKRSGLTSQTIEPVASVVLRPYGGNSDKIPNEDSTELEFDETNLFSHNRFTGIDRLEGGPRINYGLNWGISNATNDRSNATDYRSNVFFGQSYRLKADSTFASGTGLEENLSDLVGKVEIAASKFLDFLYRTRLATDNFEPRRNEARLSAGAPAFRFTGGYVFLDQQAGSEFSGREELNITASSQLNREWRTSIDAVRDLNSSEMRSLGMRLIYEDECLVFHTSLTRTFYQDRDLKPTDAINFFLTLKTIGEIKSDFFGFVSN